MGIPPTLAPPPTKKPGLSEKKIRDEFSGEVGKLLAHHVLSDFDTDRAYQYLDLRRNYAFYKGNYDSSPSLAGGTVDWRRTSSGQLSVAAKRDQSIYDYVCNIFRGDTRKLVAVVGQRPPNMQAGPRTPNNEAQVDRARKAQLAADFWHDVVDAPEVQRELVFSLGVAGTTFGYVSYRTDKSVYGATEEPKWTTEKITIDEESYQCESCEMRGPIEESPEIDREMGTAMCPECGQAAQLVPPVTEDIAIQTDETVEYANGGVEISIVNGLHVSTQRGVKSLKDSGYLLYEYDEDPGKLKSLYPVLRDSTNVPSVSQSRNVLDQEARDEAASMYGEEYSSQNSMKWRYSRFWIRPWMYEHMSDRARTEFEKSYPNGVKLTFVNDKWVECTPESIDDVWVACKPDQDEGMWVTGYLTDMVQCAEVVNDAMRILIELMEKGVPINLINPKIIDPKQLRNKGGRVGEFVPALRHATGNFKDAIHTIKAAEMDSSLSQVIDTLISLYRQAVTGLTPAVYGGGNYNTAREAEIARSQALSMLATLWSNTRSFWQQVTLLAVRQLAKYTDGTLHRPDGDEEDALFIEGMEDILKGGYSFTAAEGFPMNPAQVADKIQAILETGNPEVVELLGMNEPENMPAIEAAIGLPGWKLPTAEARKYMMMIIERLLSEQPVQQVNPMTGQLERVSSIVPNDIVIDPPLAFRIIRSWIWQDGGKSEMENEEGFMNLMLYADGFKQMMMGPPPGAPPASGGGAPPPPEAVGDPAMLPEPTEAEIPAAGPVPEPVMAA